MSGAAVSAAPARDRAWMLAAVRLGARGDRAVRPNPRVGCLIVQGERIVGQGWHAQVGGPHAEAIAIAAAGEAARGATAYVTLAPCNHWGRTPPCAAALVAAGIRRVVVGVGDPNPTAAGGCEALRAAGVAVDVGVAAEDCRDLAEVFLCGIDHGRSFFQVKVAMTLDGRVAAADGTSRWITGPGARRAVHAMRAEADAVLVGSGTALADNPRLDLRALTRQKNTLKPLRIVLDRRLRLPVTGQLAQTAAQATLVVTDDPRRESTAEAEALRERGVSLLVVPPAPAWLTAVAAALAQRGIHHVLCEPGPTLHAALWRERLVDRLDLFVAPRLLGDGLQTLPSLGIHTLADAIALRWSAPRRVDGDLWLTARPVRG